MRALIAGVAIALASPSFAVTGNEYFTLSESERLAYTLGAVDGVLTGLLLESGEQPRLAVCLGEIPPSQIFAIFEKALSDRPEQWDFPASFVLHDALSHPKRIRSFLKVAASEGRRRQRDKTLISMVPTGTVSACTQEGSRMGRITPAAENRRNPGGPGGG